MHAPIGPPTIKRPSTTFGMVNHTITSTATTIVAGEYHDMTLKADSHGHSAVH